MTALITALANVVGVLYIGLILINPNGTIATNGAVPVTIASGAPADINAGINTAAIGYAAGLGYTITSSDVLSYFQPMINPKSYNYSVSRSIVTGTGATGFQVDANRDSTVVYNVTIGTTATIGGNSSGTVVLEIAPTNSSTASDWKEVARLTNGQSITLALTLQSVQTAATPLMTVVPAGYYVKLRSINNTGTPTYTYNTGYEVLL